MYTEMAHHMAKQSFSSDPIPASLYPLDEQTRTLEADATTGGGRLLEKRYGLDFCLNISMSGLGPLVYPPRWQERGREGIG